MSPRPGPQPFRQETQSFFFSSLLKYSCFFVCLFFHFVTQLVGSQFPDQGLNLVLAVESPES